MDRTSIFCCRNGSRQLSGKKFPSSYAVVNRLRSLMFQGKTVKLFTDPELLIKNTVGGLVFCNNYPVYSFYRSNLFNKSAETRKTASVPCSVPERHNSFISIISYKNLGLSDTAEISDFFLGRDIVELRCKKFNGYSR
jgi:hypothetical protein